MSTLAVQPQDPPLWRDLLRTDALALIPRLSLLLVIPVESSTPVVIVSIIASSVVALFPRLYQSATLWLVIFAVRGVDQYVHWHGLDDHIVLITYWCLALGLAFLTTDPARSLAVSGRLLLGLTMAWAVVHKVTAPEFLDGTFMHFTLLIDTRFEMATRWIGGMPADVYASNQASWLGARAFDPSAGVIESNQRVTAFAWALTVGSLVLESALALAFLSPDRWWRRLPSIRLALLLTFLLTTYAIVPVSYFGLILVIMAISADDKQEHIRWYIASIVGLVIWPVIWTWLADIAAA